MSAAALRVDGLVHRYAGHGALDGVGFTALAGVLTVLGPNGAGKSTLLRGVATVQTLQQGSIHIDGLDVRRAPERTEARRRIGYLPQEPRFAPRATVFDVVDYLAICKEHRDRRSRHREVRRVLELADLHDRCGDRVRSLSGGMVRRLGLAQALLGSPRLLVLDEPAAGLDPEQRLRLRDLLSRLSVHTTVLVSSHMLDEAAAVSSNVVVLNEGRLAYAGTATGLAQVASGRVWLSDHPVESAARHWRLPDGRYRCIGDPPALAVAVEPTAEDGYLLLMATARLQA